MTLFYKYHYEDVLMAYQDMIIKRKLEDTSERRREFYLEKVHGLINHCNIPNYQDIRDIIKYFLLEE